MESTEGNSDDIETTIRVVVEATKVKDSDDEDDGEDTEEDTEDIL